MTQRLDEAESVFAAARPRLFGIAYRMTGSVADAEDLVQEVWLRWQLADRTAVLNPEAYLAVITVTASAKGIDQVLWLVNPEKLAAFQ